ncbi:MULTISPECIES: copper resistance CopC family protein [unclassified Agromyces]|uniref:copper resistance CopC family protein n=1 Tax=unclassified Agromyces TaxID=2639701 RepID=UPI003014BB73
MSAASIRTTAAAAASALALAWAALAAPVPAFAHNSVIDEGPEADSRISAQPGEVWIETNDALLDLDGATALDVIGPDGRHYATGCPTVDGAIASAPADLGPAGEYTVAWRVVSADGHPITGDFAFDWAPADGEAVAQGSAEAACGAASGGDAGVDAGSAGGEADETSDAAASGAGDAVWIAGAVIAVLAAGVAAFALTRRRPGPDAATDVAPEESSAAGAAEASAPGDEPRDGR